MSESHAMTDPLTETVRGDGAVFGPWQGRDTILHFGDRLAEYTALAVGAGLVDLGDRTQIEIRGADRASFLHRMATNRIVGLAPGSGCETFFADAKGHVVAHALALVRPDSIVLDAAAGQAEALVEHLSRYIVREQVELHDRSDQWRDFLVGGPKAGGLLERLLDGPLPSEPLAHREVRLDGTPVSLRSVVPGWRPGCLVTCPVDAAAAVWRVVRDAGVRPCGRLAFDAIRIEAGWPEYGRDILADNLPQEIGRDDHAISFDKGCYLGQETVARIESRGHVNKRLVGLRFATREVPAADTELTHDGKPVGRVTSAAFSPWFGAAVALGYVRAERAEPGAQLESPFGAVEVVALPMRGPHSSVLSLS